MHTDRKWPGNPEEYFYKENEKYLGALVGLVAFSSLTFSIFIFHLAST